MGQISLIIIILTLIFSFSATGSVMAQTVNSGTDLFQTQPFPTLPPVFSSYPMIPLEDLDSFEKSTLVPSTLGAKAERRDNLTVNTRIGRFVLNSQQVEGRSAEVDFIPSEPNVELIPLPSRTSEKFYRWNDEDGVLHVTNDLDSVPSKYRSRVEIQR